MGSRRSSDAAKRPIEFLRIVAGFGLSRSLADALGALRVGQVCFLGWHMNTLSRPPYADEACKDLLVFLALRKNSPAAAQAFEDFQKSGAPIFTCNYDRAATVIAGEVVGVYQLTECLMRHVAAFRAEQRVGNAPNGIGHGIPS